VPELTGAELRRAFDAPEPLTVGIEDEVMLLDPASLDLAPHAAAALERVAGDPRFAGELPAAQLEIRTVPARTAAEAIDQLAEARRDLAGALAPTWRLAAAGVHPFAAVEGELSDAPRYEATRSRFGRHARRQLAFALQVHVAVGGADRMLAVYNGLRSYLPALAALAANARWYDGRDSEFASIRPKIADLLPRQGVPPRLDSWDEYAAALRWGAASGSFEPASWWWELRPHVRLGTLEVRAPDAQASVDDAAGVVALVHALVAHLAALHDAGEALPEAPRWRIEENRWYAARYGLDAELVDLTSGERRGVRDLLDELVAEVEPAAARVGCRPLLARTRALVAENGADRQRRAGDAGGAQAVAEQLAGAFSPPGAR
jgi:carboxylate-amine ligase